MYDPELPAGYQDADLEMRELTERAHDLDAERVAIAAEWREAYERPGPSPSAHDLATYAAEVTDRSPDEQTLDAIADRVYKALENGVGLDACAELALDVLMYGRP